MLDKVALPLKSVSSFQGYEVFAPSCTTKHHGEVIGNLHQAAVPKASLWGSHWHTYLALQARNHHGMVVWGKTTAPQLAQDFSFETRWFHHSPYNQLIYADPMFRSAWKPQPMTTIFLQFFRVFPPEFEKPVKLIWKSRWCHTTTIVLHLQATVPVRSRLGTQPSEAGSEQNDDS